MRIANLITLNLVLFVAAGFVSAEETTVTAVPTAVPVLATPTPAASSSATRSSSTVSRKLQPQSVTIHLLDGMKLSGELTEVDQWTMKTSFGATSLPLSTVAGMRMAHEGDAVTTVVLHNGDALTGAVDIDLVVIQTEWGRAEINGNHVASILFTPGLKWTNETGLNGTRWKLAADEPPKPAAPAAVPGQPARPGVYTNQVRPGYRQ